jgi:hypothetical protein
MIKRCSKKSVVFTVSGFVLESYGYTVMQQEFGNKNLSLACLGLVGVLLGTFLLLIGLAYYAKAKGRHPAWCVLAFLSIVGLIALACLEDKAPNDALPPV